MLERHFVSSELSCGIGILHKSIGFSGVVWCDVDVDCMVKSVFLRAEILCYEKSLCKVHNGI